MNDSNSISKALKALEAEALDAIETVSETDDLERLRITYMGRKEGSLSVLLRELSTLDSSERPAEKIVTPGPELGQKAGWADTSVQNNAF